MKIEKSAKALTLSCLLVVLGFSESAQATKPKQFINLPCDCTYRQGIKTSGPNTIWRASCDMEVTVYADAPGYSLIATAPNGHQRQFFTCGMKYSQWLTRDFRIGACGVPGSSNWGLGCGTSNSPQFNIAGNGYSCNRNSIKTRKLKLPKGWSLEARYGKEWFAGADISGAGGFNACPVKTSPPVKHDCNDKLDNDWDGRIDAKDPQCRGDGRSEHHPRGLQAQMECVDRNYKDGTFTAHFSYTNKTGKVLNIPNASKGWKTNRYFLNGKSYTPKVVNTLFLRGNQTGRFSVTAKRGQSIDWWLGIYREITGVTAEWSSPQCAKTEPIGVCTDRQGNAIFGVHNKKYFEPMYNLGIQNNFNKAPVNRGQGVRFKVGDTANAFKTPYQNGLTWTLGGNTARAVKTPCH